MMWASAFNYADLNKDAQIIHHVHGSLGEGRVLGEASEEPLGQNYNVFVYTSDVTRK